MIEFLFNTNDDRSVQKLSSVLDALNDRHKDNQVTYHIAIKKNRPVRSVDQNRKYWGLLTAIAHEIGETKENLHFWYGLEFIPQEVGGKIIPRSTTDLNDGEMSIYIKQVEQHAKDFHGVKIVHPTDETYGLWERYHKNKYDELFGAS